MQNYELKDDVLHNAEDIAEFLGEPVRRVRYMLEKGDLPCFKLRGRWYGRKSALLQHFKHLEVEAMGARNEKP